MANVRRLFLPFLLLLLWPLTAPAAPIVPLATRNQSPLVQIFGIPAVAGAHVTPTGHLDTQLRYDLANDFTTEDQSGETMILDGETTRLGLGLRYGLPRGFEIGVEVPYVAHRGGFLDHFIESYHDFFNFPQGGRDDYPTGRVYYEYTKHGQTRFLYDEENGGLGDISVTGAWQLHEAGGKSPSALALRASLKLPTGDSAKLLGSGGTDLALGLSGDLGSVTDAGYFSLFGGLGGVWLGDGDVLSDQQRNVVVYGHLGGGWEALSWLTLLAQLDGHSPVYKDSELPQLANVALQLTLGGTLQLPAETFLDLGVSEDIFVSTTPDVAFLVALRRRF